MPYTEKQNRLFRAVAHGWKPDKPGLEHLDMKTAARLAAEGVKRVGPNKKGGVRG